MGVLMNWILFTVFIFGAFASDEEKKIDEDTIPNLVAKTLTNIYDKAKENLKVPDEECMVCFEHFPLSFQFSCGHEVCAVCAESIMNKCVNDNCPKCRKPLPQWQIEEWLILLKIYPIALTPDIPVEKLQRAFPLICSVANLPTVTKCVKTMAVNVNTEGFAGGTPLSMSSQAGNLPVVEYLINNGAVVNQTDDDGSTSLVMSSANGHLSVVEYLINNGANVNQANDYGVTPLMVAVFQNHTKIAKFLLRKKANIETAKLFLKNNEELIEILDKLCQEIEEEIQ